MGMPCVGLYLSVQTRLQPWFMTCTYCINSNEGKGVPHCWDWQTIHYGKAGGWKYQFPSGIQFWRNHFQNTTSRVVVFDFIGGTRKFHYFPYSG